MWDLWLFKEQILQIKVANIVSFLFQREKLRVYCKHYPRKCLKSSQLFKYLLLLKQNFQRFGFISSKKKVNNDVRYHLKEFDT